MSGVSVDGRAREGARDRRDAVLAIGTVISFACTYALNILLSRRLGTASYGELASLVTITVIGSIPGLALQLFIARFVVRHLKAPGTRLPGSFARFTLGVTGVSMLVSGVGMAALAPTLNTPAVPAVVVVLLMVPATNFLSAAQGVLQGRDRMRALAVLFVVVGLARLVAGYAAAHLHGGAAAPVIGMAAGTWLAAVVGWVMIGALPHGPGAGPTWPGVLRIVGAAGSIWALGNVDIVLARSSLDHHSAGLYSAGALIARAVQFAPQYVVVTTFARFADAHETRHMLVRAVVRLSAIGALATVGAAALAPSLVPLVFGHGFRDLGHVAWGFAVLGWLLALNQLLVSQRVARHDEGAAIGVWLAAVVFVVTVAVLPGLTADRLLVVGCVVNAVLAGALWVRASAKP